jgi:uncharacterized protein
MDHLTRRLFLMRSSAVAAGFAGLQSTLARGAVAQLINSDPETSTDRFGPMLKDPDGILNLPKGFHYRILSPMGAEMDDGLIVPGKHDAMAAFPYINDDGSTDPDRCVLVRNHEIEDAHRTISPFGPRNERLDLVESSMLFDRGFGKPSRGGCTSLVYNLKEQKMESHWLSLAATERNCAGGITPWGSWITCEETATTKGTRFEHDHGWCFEVPVTNAPKLADPIPLKGLGRFMHEAVCIDPSTGIVYLTEDRHDSLLYRFVPDTKPTKAGDLRGSGKLQALMVFKQASMDTRNWDIDLIKVGDSLACSWITLDDTDSPKDDLRYRGFEMGAARFARGEGMWWGGDNDGAAYFACTTGGKAGAGQIWKLTPNGKREGIDSLELFIEPNDPSVLQNADNITFSPWGDMFVCEDGEAPQYLVGVRPDGSLYQFAKNNLDGSEFAGVCFSPDGSTMFVNHQQRGWTLAITGPWE